ncbi:hypothetical protein [Flagellimonas profundi]|uniref:HEPN domain-containing protein n=1 Tax=Flagellimonas profundi TaxID=2915620 RepID=A0ABS3FIQ5_9FLAO|nr:hypothetical protein [Allomuricauda profundi]MBO0343067.1 hypothetical protein [Allomuricauda profundi]
MDSLKQKKKQLDPRIQGLLSDLIKVIPSVVQVYLNKGHDKRNPFRYRWNILIDAPKSDISNKFLPIVQGLFHDHKDDFHNVFSLVYAKTELANGNLYFINHCRTEHLIFGNQQINFPGIYFENQTNEKFQSNFRASLKGCLAFQKGFKYFMSDNNLSQAAFMAHQAFELGYRVLEGFLCGKVKICHKIEVHQKFMERSIHRTKGMFKLDDNTEMELLERLDRAYSSSRYDNSFHIERDQLDILEQKLECFLDEIRLLFEEELELLKTIVTNGKKTSPETQNREEPNLLDAIRQLGEDNFAMMRPANRWTKKGYYLNHVYMHSHFSLFCSLRSTLNVCILALDEHCDMTLDIKNVKEDVKTVLEFTKNLVPLEEGIYLDEMRKLMLSDKETTT